jgi:hypothetical protein
VTSLLIAALRIAEQRVRRSRALRAVGARAMARLARSSKNARAFVRLRLMRLV